MPRSTLIAVSLFLPVVLAAQTAPRLDPVAVPPALALLDFKIDLTSSFIVHPSGCVVLFDVDMGQVVCIDPTSGATRRFGRKGAGPGEFGAVRSMIPTLDGGVLIFDWRNLRFTTITGEWKLGTVVPTATNYTIVGRPTGDSVLVLGGARGYELLAVSLHDGKGTVRFAPSRGDSAGIFQGAHQYEYGFWLIPRQAGGWYVVPPWRYQILIEDERGIKRSTFGRELPPELPSEREATAMRLTMVKGNPGHVEAAERLAAEWAKSPKPPIPHAPAEDGRGRLWIVTGRIRADSTELDAFDANGHFLGTRRLPGDVKAVTIHGLDLYAIVEYLSGDNEGAQGVLHYRIR